MLLFKGTTKLNRRNLIQSLLASLPVAFNVAGVRYLLGNLVDEAYGAKMADVEPTFFLEINLRDQWDFGHVMVAPGLATATDPIVGATGRKLAMFHRKESLRRYPGNIFLTPTSMPLAPHVDSIAMLELCELTMGTIHGHEAANALRSPGRSYLAGSGRQPMWERDPHSKVGGNEHHYSSTPTPACLHNQVQRTLSSDIACGYTFKGIGRPAHTVYHFPADLPLGDLDRFQSKEELLRAFRTQTTSVLADRRQARKLAELLNRFDSRTLREAGVSETVLQRHQALLQQLPEVLYSQEAEGRSLELTEAEKEYWLSGVPAQRSMDPKLNICDQLAYACKAFKMGVARTASIEFDYLDVHDQRSEEQMEVMAKQTVLPLARAISYLKEAGLYDRTLILVNTLDGGRAPAANSYGSEGKNAVMVAGGKIKGGYYGDITIAGADGDGHRYRYHAPDIRTGIPNSEGTLGSGQRVAGASVWKTIMRGTGLPDEMLDYPDVRGAPLLDFLLR